jgi:hypothetical protein
VKRPAEGPVWLPEPPDTLSEASGALWTSILTSHEMSDAELEVLRSALAALDRADQAAGVLASEGLTVVDRYGGVRSHPMLDAELRARTLYARLVKQLGVELAPGATRRGRPGGSATGRGHR